MKSFIQLIVFVLLISFINGDDDDSISGFKGEGFGFPLSAFSSKNSGSNSNSKNVFKPMANDMKSKGVLAGQARRDDGVLSANSFNRNNGDENWEGFLKRGKEEYEKTIEGRRRLNIFGSDGRLRYKPNQMDTYPYTAMGRFVRGTSFCSGTVVGAWLVLTNHHCLGITANEQLPEGFWDDAGFLIGYSQNDWNYRASFDRVIWSSASKDYAILQMTENLGYQAGWVGIQWYTQSYFKTNHNVAVVAYSGDLLEIADVPGVQFDCKTHGPHEENDVRHDCDTTSGSSGSGILKGDWYTCTECETEPCPCVPKSDVDIMLIGLNWGHLYLDQNDRVTYETYSNNIANLMKPAALFKDDYFEAYSWKRPGDANPGKSVSFKLHVSSVLVLLFLFLN